MSSTAELEWTPVKQAIVGPDPELLLYAEIFRWFRNLDLFRLRENQRMYLHEPTAEDLEIHRGLALRMIADGERLEKLIEQSGGLVENREGIKADDLRAAIETLRDSYRGWHEPRTEERRAEVLRSVFKDVA